jgi:hypothetical protein
MLGRVLSWAFKRGLRQGVAGGSGPWLVVAAVAGLWQLARRPARPQVIRMKLEPGARYTIVCSDEPGRR